MTMTTNQPATHQDRLAMLAATPNGPVLAPGDDRSAAERAGFDLLATHQPSVVVGATDAFDVQAVVRYAAQAGLPAAVMCTGS